MFSRFLCAVSFLIALAYSSYAAPIPPALEKALSAYQAEGARGWVFTQNTQTRAQKLVERYDPALPEFKRWTLLEKNGRPPTEKELNEYKQMLARRTRGEAAPNVKDQIRPETCEPLGASDGRARYRFQLKPGDENDRSAAHMAVTFSLHEATGAIERVELASQRAFSPMFAVKIDEARTIITYTLPDDERPSLLERIEVRVRGRAFFFKSLDQDMTVTYVDYAPGSRKS